MKVDLSEGEKRERERSGQAGLYHLVLIKPQIRSPELQKQKKKKRGGGGGGGVGFNDNKKFKSSSNYTSILG